MTFNIIFFHIYTRNDIIFGLNPRSNYDKDNLHLDYSALSEYVFLLSETSNYCGGPEM